MYALFSLESEPFSGYCDSKYNSRKSAICNGQIEDEAHSLETVVCIILVGKHLSYKNLNKSEVCYLVLQI